MEKHCVSLEIAKQLKKAGWKKETEFSYCDTADKRFGRKEEERFYLYPKVTTSAREFNSGGKDIQCPAPLATEILEELPVGIKFENYKSICGKSFTITYGQNADSIIWDNLLPNALAKMWLYLIKE